MIIISLFRILFEIVLYSESILKILTRPSAKKEDHYILVAGGPLGQCSRKLISNPDVHVTVSLYLMPNVKIILCCLFSY